MKIIAGYRPLSTDRIFLFLFLGGPFGPFQGTVLRDVPMVSGKLLDLVALLETITKRGGVRRVQDKGLWDEVSPTSKHIYGTTLRNLRNNCVVVVATVRRTGSQLFRISRCFRRGSIKLSHRSYV